MSGVNANVRVEELSKLSDEELDKLIQQLNRGYVKAPMISIIEVRQQFEQRRQERMKQIEELDDDGP